MALLEVLDRHGVSYDKEEVKKRHDLLIKGLRRDPAFEKELAEFKKGTSSQKGGADEIPIPVKMTKDDFLGSEARWFVEVMGSPYAQVVIRILFSLLFFVSYLENIPAFGTILSAVLDVTLAGGRILVKTLQKMIPPVVGIIPLPFMSFVGIAIASAVGMLLWPILAMISFSRQDFTSAIESFLRIIPPPIGDAIADTFLDANRTVYKLNDKRKKLVDELVSGLQTVMDVGKQTGTKIGEGASTLITQAREVASKPVPGKDALLSEARSLAPKFGGRFSRKVHKKNKWRKTQRRRQNS